YQGLAENSAHPRILLSSPEEDATSSRKANFMNRTLEKYLSWIYIRYLIGLFHSMKPFLLCLFWILSLCVLYGQGKASLFDTLYSADPISIRLTYEFDSISRIQENAIQGTITLKRNHYTLLQDEPVSIEVRGKFRRMKCTDMPPLELKF